MDCLKNKPVYEYSQNQRSTINYNGYTNCCLISSFQIGMKKIYPEFPSLEILLKELFPDTKNAYLHFAIEFPQKWNILKTYLIKSDISWKEKLDSIVLRFFTPLVSNNKKGKTCVLISVIDVNKVNGDEVAMGNYITLEAAMSDNVEENKIAIDIIQLYNHFEPIVIGEKNRDRSDSIECSVNKSFFS